MCHSGSQQASDFLRNSDPGKQKPDPNLCTYSQIFDQPVRPGPPGNLVTGWSLANRKLVGTQEEHALHYTALHKDAAAFFASGTFCLFGLVGSCVYIDVHST
jgi:hypothetical protein